MHMRKAVKQGILAAAVLLMAGATVFARQLVENADQVVQIIKSDERQGEAEEDFDRDALA